jgi:hypothetical protein
MYPFKAVYRAAMQVYLPAGQPVRRAARARCSLNVTSAQQFEHKSGAIWKDQQGVLDDLLQRDRNPARAVLL